jgi:hypothetical protein
MLGPPRKGWKTWYAHKHIMGDETNREKYATRKRSQIRPIAEVHERAAQEAASQAEFTIPQDRGFLLFPPGKFPEVPEIIELARQRIAEVRPGEGKSKRKTQLRTGNLDNSTLDLQSAYLRFALRPDILSAVAGYLGTAPLLTQVDVWYSMFAGPGLQNSQLYHCDWTDTKQIKLFILATDVDEASGPLVMMGADTSKKLREKIGYKWASEHNKLQDEEVYAAVGRDDETPIVGPAGTVAFLDTSRCFHFGSRVTEESDPRILVLNQYLTPTAFSFPREFREAVPFAHMANSPGLSQVQKLALGGQ